MRTPARRGLRAGEAIGLEIDKHISEDFRTLNIRQKVRRTKLELFLKTDAGRRDVDLCPKLTALLKAFVGNRTPVFSSKSEWELSLTDESLETGITSRLGEIEAAQSRHSLSVATALHGSERIASTDYADGSPVQYDVEINCKNQPIRTAVFHRVVLAGGEH